MASSAQDRDLCDTRHGYINSGLKIPDSALSYGHLQVPFYVYMSGSLFALTDTPTRDKV